MASTDSLHGASSTSATYTLPGVLHYLQTEWRRFERERNEWEIEKGELNSRIALLEGERQGLENVKIDLLRRNKMLEYALKQERAKYSQGGGGESPTRGDNTSPVGTSLSAVSHIRDRFEKEKPSTTYSKAKMGTVRSREILRSYLQEVNLLTTKNVSTRPGGQSAVRQYTTSSLPAPSAQRQLVKPTNDPNAASARRASLPIHMIDAAASLQPSATVDSAIAEDEAATSDTSAPRPADAQAESTAQTRADAVNSGTAQTERHIVLPMKLTKSSRHAGRDTASADSDQQVTINGGSSGSSKDDKLVIPADRMNKMLKSWEKDNQHTSGGGGGGGGKKRSKNARRDSSAKSDTSSKGVLDAELASLSLGDVVAENESSVEKSSDLKLWKPKFTLRSHYDTIRAVATHPTQPLVVSASEDGTVKTWNLLNALSPTSKRQVGHDIEPSITFRGHAGPVTCVALDTDRTWGNCDRIFTGSTDASIRVWKLDTSRFEPYSSYDTQNKLAMFVGHSDVVWDVKVHPYLPVLASASADGTVKLWLTDLKSSPLRHTISHPFSSRSAASATLHPNPTSLDFVQTDLKHLAVAYQNSSLKIYDTETGQEVSDLTAGTDIQQQGAFTGQINNVISHSTMSLLVTAHEDRYIRFFDTNSGKAVHSMVAHLDAVSTLDINASGLTLVSGGHDCSVRFWDIGTKACMQEFTAHRRKYDEGIWSVQYHPSLPLMVSGGADSVVKVYT
ncbi:1,2-dihydroxy-3-keto-5-methylthiopentene dioxygenase [Sorochytrium milnesiophthora]